MNRSSKYKNIQSFKTKDSSEIRELIHPSHNGNQNQSVAEATVKRGTRTIPHHHRVSEEIYLTIEGTGKLYIKKWRGEKTIEIKLKKGVSAIILPRELHWLENTGDNELKILCCCSPAYSHEDTFLEV